jgi:hypothetical protein
MKPKSLLAKEREVFHKLLLENVLLIDKNGIPSNADKDQKSSVQFATNIAKQLFASIGERQSGQSSGNQFEQIVAVFLNNTFPKLANLRPGKWSIYQVGSRSKNKIAEFAQYEHLRLLNELSKNNAPLAASLGNDYSIAPDIVITRGRESDSEINLESILVDNNTGTLSDLRTGDSTNQILHASISTKWTLRSDRAQNARSEALNLIRNRKGRTPHIVVVTGEPTPSRLSSLALGTGDIDCVYHFALPELIAAVEESGNDEALKMLEIMVHGKRLKDIADLPLDLAV